MNNQTIKADAGKRATETVRADLLHKAEQIVCQDREGQYGSPENNFKLIADMWNKYLTATQHESITARDVTIMMALLKIARIATGQSKEDNYIDLIGYAACAGELEVSSGQTNP